MEKELLEIIDQLNTFYINDCEKEGEELKLSCKMIEVIGKNLPPLIMGSTMCVCAVLGTIKALLESTMPKKAVVLVGLMQEILTESSMVMFTQKAVSSNGTEE